LTEALTDINGDKKYYVVGVVSYGHWNDCGKQGIPGVYTRVSKFLDWIEENGKKLMTTKPPLEDSRRGSEALIDVDHNRPQANVCPCQGKK
jgi:secreted trypsin-like serine protease